MIQYNLNMEIARSKDMNNKYGFGLIIFIIGLVLVYLGLLLTQSPECGIAVAIVYLAAIISIQGHGKQ